MGMETPPAIFSMQFTGGRWLMVAPSEPTTFTRTFDRKELRIGDDVAGVGIDRQPLRPLRAKPSRNLGVVRSA
jgi:hypothetical protein